MLLHGRSIKIAFSKEFNDEIPKSKQYGILGCPSTAPQLIFQVQGRSNAIREASYNLERYHLNLDKELSKELYDLGNMQVAHGNIQKTSHYLESTIQEVKDLEIIPITLGGEHGISYSVVGTWCPRCYCCTLRRTYDLRNAYQVKNIPCHSDEANL